VRIITVANDREDETMSRFLVSTCGVVAEALAFDAAGPLLVMGIATVGLMIAG
jgi:hypothetical protein